jgi:mono/diheme cytochrome c family protein
VACTLVAALAAEPHQVAAAGARGGVPGRQIMGAGPADRPPVDDAAATRGRTKWNADCASCHGNDARGTEKGPNLIRSSLVLHDRVGSELGPFLKKGHPAGAPASVTDDQVVDLANFLRQRVNDSFRGSPIFTVRDILTGDKAAGEAFFNGEGGCTKCHSATGDLAGIGGKYEPVDLQQRMLFPGGGRGRGRGASESPKAAVKVTVTPASGQAVSGTLVEMNDFTVTLLDADGITHTFKRGPDVKVTKTDPLETHHELLDRLTDKNMHDLVAYLESLK